MGRTGSRSVPQDPVLHALPELLPESGAPDFVRRAAEEATDIDLGAAEGKIAYVRYRPTRACVVLWSFTARSGERLLVSGRLFRDERGARVQERPAFVRRSGGWAK